MEGLDRLMRTVARTPETLSDRIYRVLKSRIGGGHLVPGLVIREADLSEAMEIGRTPIRTALLRLADEGLLVKRNGRGFRVRSARSGGAEIRRPLLEVDAALRDAFGPPALLRDWRHTVFPVVERTVASCLMFGRFQINQTVLAENFGVSRTIAHEILVNLERVGFVHQEGNSRWYCGPLGLDELHDMYELRWTLEPVALRQAAGTLETARLREIRDTTRALAHREDWNAKTLNDAEAALHVDTVLNCTNRRMSAVLRYCQLPVIVTYGTVARFAATGRPPTGIPETLAEHVQILELLCDGDIDRAAEALGRHIRHGFEFVLPHFSNLPAQPGEELPPYITPV